MRYVFVRLRQKQEEETYRIYLTDALYAEVNGGQTLTKRYIELLHYDEKEVEERSPEEIKDKIANGLRRLTE